jgi:hypothetical protein
LPSLEAEEPSKIEQKRDSASAKWSNRNHHTLIAVRRTFPLVGPDKAASVNFATPCSPSNDVILKMAGRLAGPMRPQNRTK